MTRPLKIKKKETDSYNLRIVLNNAKVYETVIISSNVFVIVFIKFDRGYWYVIDRIPSL